VFTTAPSGRTVSAPAATRSTSSGEASAYEPHRCEPSRCSPSFRPAVPRRRSPREPAAIRRRRPATARPSGAPRARSPIARGSRRCLRGAHSHFSRRLRRPSARGRRSTVRTRAPRRHPSPHSSPPSAPAIVRFTRFRRTAIDGRASSNRPASSASSSHSPSESLPDESRSATSSPLDRAAPQARGSRGTQRRVRRRPRSIERWVPRARRRSTVRGPSRRRVPRGRRRRPRDRGRRNPLDGVVFLAQFDLAGFAVEQVRVDDPLAREVRVLERDRPPGANERDGVGLEPVSSRISTRTCSSGSPSANPETPPHRPQVPTASLRRKRERHPMAEERGDDVSRLVARGVGVRAHTMAHGDRERVAFERAVTDHEALSPDHHRVSETDDRGSSADERFSELADERTAMTRIAIVSDTHVPTREPELPAWVVTEIKAADHTIHAGDFESFGAYERIVDLTGGELTAVRGNVDPATLDVPTTATLEIDGARSSSPTATDRRATGGNESSKRPVRKGRGRRIDARRRRRSHPRGGRRDRRVRRVPPGRRGPRSRSRPGTQSGERHRRCTHDSRDDVRRDRRRRRSHRRVTDRLTVGGRPQQGEYTREASA